MGKGDVSIFTAVNNTIYKFQYPIENFYLKSNIQSTITLSFKYQIIVSYFDVKISKNVEYVNIFKKDTVYFAYTNIDVELETERSTFYNVNVNSTIDEEHNIQ